MKKLRSVPLVVCTIVALVGPSSLGLAAGVDAFPICIGTKPTGLGSPSIDLNLIASSAGSSFQLTGQVVFSQPVSPPASLVTYAVTGSAVPNADGYWVSLVGTGYDLAKTVFVGMIGIQLSADEAKNSLTYAKQSLDAATTQTFTRVPEIKACPAP
jgi:hypothetical protein